MSPVSGAGGRRGVGLAIFAVVIALVAILVLARPRQDPYLRKPLDPRGTGRDGLAASVALLRRFGSPVHLGGLPMGTDEVVLQAADRLSGRPQRDLATWVRRGGTLVVTDPASPLAAPEGRSGAGSSNYPRGCTLDALSAVGQLGVALPSTLRHRTGESYCFADPAAQAGGDDRAGVVVRRSGAGLIVTVSSIKPFLNQHLAEGDDAALFVALVGPSAGRTIRILDPNRFVSDQKVGDGTILGALPARGRQALLEFAVAFVLWGLARGRRLGRPVPEELPVPVPGSDLVLAIGEMLARGDDLAGVAARLRRRSRRELGVAVGLGADPEANALIAALCDHVTVDQAELRRALLDPVPDVAALLDVSHQLDRLREELHVVPTPS